ncbi:lipopolysaccharide biosynthesis protein [Pseudomonas helleri]|uniref:lipopolysaccharide biosynthesis protein n=1 Tax=Pseudomonas helleri TaxID=1608996 RepID=UPI003FCF07C8
MKNILINNRKRIIKLLDKLPINLNNQLYKAISKSMLGRYSVYAVNLLSMIILARIFTPETFGTVAAITVFFLFFQLMAEAGLGPAIININELSTKDKNGLFGLTLIIGLILGFAFFLLSPVFLYFYNLPRVGEVVPYIAISLVFFSASILPNAFLLREQAFFSIARAGLCAEVGSTLVSVLLVQVVDPLHALATKSVCSAAISFCILYFISGKTEFGRPAVGTKFSAIKPLLSFSLYQFGFNFINYFSRNFDNILVGRYFGANSLGVYDKAYQLMRYPLMLLTYSMTPAIQPVIRKYADDKEKVERIHRDFTFKLSLAGAIAGLSLFLLSELIVRIMLGPQWLLVIPLIKVLAIAIPVQVVLSTIGSFFQALNRADLLFYTGIISAVVMISCICWGVYQHDLIKLSWALVIAFHINFLQSYYVMYIKIFNKKPWGFMARMLPALAIVIFMTILAVYNTN